MLMKKCIRVAALCIALGLPLVGSAASGEWHFKVTNKTDSRITKLQVSENGKSWGNFDIGSGIAPRKTMTLVWDSSTDNQACTQWMRAQFSDGSYSEPGKQDFCEDLDTPIEFTE